MTDVTAMYSLNLAMSGKLKLRASARLAEGTPDTIFEACVLLHEAARIERRAIDALPGPPPSTRLASAIEECWCLVEGRDPERAGHAWGRVLEQVGHVDATLGKALLTRLSPRFNASERAFKAELAKCKHLMQLRTERSLVPATKRDRLAVHLEVSQVLKVFPGSATFWWANYRLLDALGNQGGAWASLEKARQLDPANRNFEAMSLLLAAQWLPPAEADEHLARVRTSFDGAGAAVCLMYAHAEIEIAKKTTDARLRWSRSLDAVNAGLGQAPHESLRRNLKATQLLLAELLAGRAPTVDVLYRAGLGEAVAAAPTNQDVADLVTLLSSRNVAVNESVAHAA